MVVRKVVKREVLTVEPTAAAWVGCWAALSAGQSVGLTAGQTAAQKDSCSVEKRVFLWAEKKAAKRVQRRAGQKDVTTVES